MYQRHFVCILANSTGNYKNALKPEQILRFDGDPKPNIPTKETIEAGIADMNRRVEAGKGKRRKRITVDELTKLI